jgi:hypothetical protein
MSVPATPLEDELLATLRTLPAARQREVLDFAAFIKQRAPARADEPRPFGLCAGERRVPEPGLDLGGARQVSPRQAAASASCARRSKNATSRPDST